MIKVGGNVIDHPDALTAFLKDFAAVDGHKLLVHGGGKIATMIGEKMGLPSRYIHGRRITDDETIDIVTMVYGGLVNKRLVARLQAIGTRAIGLTGADANIIPARKRPLKTIDGQSVDFGWVGDIDPDGVDTAPLQAMLQAGMTPVFAPLTHDGAGHMLNTNADTIASALAVGLSENYDVRLIYCFEKKGVLEDVNDNQSVIHRIHKEKYRQLLAEKRLFEGILPKIDNAFAAIDAGVSQVLIGDAADLLENTGSHTAGTLITAS